MIGAAVGSRLGRLDSQPRLESAAVSASVPCWMCAGERLEAQDGAARAALCDRHLQARIRSLMGLR